MALFKNFKNLLSHKSTLVKIGYSIVILFAVWGFLLTSVFFAMKFGFTATTGAIDRQSDYFRDLFTATSNTKKGTLGVEAFCIIRSVRDVSQSDANTIINTAGGDSKLLSRMAYAYRDSWITNSNAKHLEENISQCVAGYVEKGNETVAISEVDNLKNATVYILPWAKSEEWIVIEKAIRKDKAVIEKVSKETGVPARLLITPLVVEQLRLFTSEREVFKRYFAPLRVLGTQTQFSLGIFGIKEDVAMRIEQNLKNKNSEYYLGAQYERLLDFDNINPNASAILDEVSLKPVASSSNATTTRTASGVELARLQRLTNEKDRYYSYLYAALYVKQLMRAWEVAGYSIDDRPEIIATLYNIGFARSHPKSDPQVGGAEIDLSAGDKRLVYTFGSIAYQFYYSGLLSLDFPF